jgi:hypothetical protein
MPVRKSEKFKDNPQISTKYRTHLSGNSLKSRIFPRFLYYVQILIRALYAIFVRRKYVFAEITKGLGPQITNPKI